MAPKTLTARILTAVLVGAVTLPVMWVCLGQLLADAADGPREALAWSSDAPRLARAAELSYAAAGQEADFAAAADMARRSLSAGPMENRALVVLAQDADRRGDRAGAARLMAAVDARTKRDTPSQLWLLEQALLREDYRSAFVHADIVLRRRSDLSDVLFPVMIAALDDPPALAPLADRMSSATPPEWRPGFLSNLASRNRPVASQLAVLVNRRSPLSAGEAKDVIDGLTRGGDDRLAYRTWRALLPEGAAPPATLVYDGAFAGAPGPPPFNWRMEDAEGSAAEISSAPDGRSALHVFYASLTSHQLAGQLLMLPAGRYQLAGEAQGGDDAATSSLRWSVTCAQDGGAVLAEVDQPQGGDWRRFAIDFSAPATGCDSQWLRLSSTPLEGFGTVEAWTAGLTIRPLEGAPADPALAPPAIRPERNR